MRTLFLLLAILAVLFAGHQCQAQTISDSGASDNQVVTNGTDAAGKDGETDVAAEAGAEMTAWETLLAKLRQGGVTVVIQILLSVLGLSVALERMVSLRRNALVPPALVAEADRLWKSEQYDQLIDVARKDGSLLGKVLEEVVRYRSSGFQVVSQLAGDVAAREFRRHIQKLFPIALVATLEPLLGLLGTMLGMIGAFETVAVAGSMGDASILADDIAKALVTTAVGLVIAIPAVFIYQYLKSQIGLGSASLDQAASGLISEWMLLGGEKDKQPAAVTSSAADAKIASSEVNDAD